MKKTIANGEEAALFASGAMRSKRHLPFWKLPYVALKMWVDRYRKGEKYELFDNETGTPGVIHNWKKAIAPNGCSDRDYIRQTYNHAFDHLMMIKELCDHGAISMVDAEGEAVNDHIGALLWNAGALAVYFDKDPLGFCAALNQLPSDNVQPVPASHSIMYESTIDLKTNLRTDLKGKKRKY